VPLHALEGVPLHDLVPQVGQRLDVLEVLLVHHEREPEPELRDVDGARLDVDPVMTCP
jgi:hypothetical protein